MTNSVPIRICAALFALILLAWSVPSGAEPSTEPPRLEVAMADANAPLTFVAYGDTRFTSPEREHEHVANAAARRALVAHIAGENPAAVFIGGDLVYQGLDPDDYATYKSETAAWAEQRIPVFPALGNHEFRGCDVEEEDSACLDNWWQTFASLNLRPYRWYSVSLGTKILVLLLDSDSPLKPGSAQLTWFEQEMTHAAPTVRFILVVLHYPPVRDPLVPRGKDEAEIARYLSHHASAIAARVIVIGSHVHNYERYSRDGIPYLVSGGGGAKPVTSLRVFGELSKLKTSVNFHYLRFRLVGDRLTGTMVRFDATDRTSHSWTEPDRFEVKAKN
jgi:acid phosphatase type 7